MRPSITAHVPKPSLLKQVNMRSSSYDDIGDPTADDGQSLVGFETLPATLSLERLSAFFDMLSSIGLALRYARRALALRASRSVNPRFSPSGIQSSKRRPVSLIPSSTAARSGRPGNSAYSSLGARQLGVIEGY